MIMCVFNCSKAERKAFQPVVAGVLREVSRDDCEYADGPTPHIAADRLRASQVKISSIAAPEKWQRAT